ncbi:MAG: dihydrodipicolinate synthase family protein [Spirochaetales bacterium]
MKPREKFQGVTVAFYAPYDKKGEIDVVAAVAQARFYRERGVRGLYLNGSSGEGFLLNVEERKKITEAVSREVAGKMNLIVHIGAAATRDSVELAKHAATCGVDALSAVPSVYYRLSEASIEHHWTQMIAATELPFIIYNIPQLTGYDLTLGLLAKMIRNPKVIGVKNSSMSTLQTEQFKKAGGPDFLVFNGPDEQYLAGRIMGADGGIGGTYGAMPELFVHLEKCYVEGKIAEAQKWQVRINEAIMELLDYPNLFSASKEILRLRGLDVGSVRSPFLPLTPADLPKVKVLHDKLMAWTAEI